ncbi:MAG TPA: DUF3866 family protein [Solirubrobacteraceae bacterium]|nr:DUF3866 family protein [Solirubrobacteraceae bacterium]
MLKLRLAKVLESGPDPLRRALPATREQGIEPAGASERTESSTGEQRMVVELTGGARSGERREAVGDVALVGRAQVGDQVVVNVQALDLGLGSGGFDVVHVNLTRGLTGNGTPGAHVMKLNYTSLQHAVEPVDDRGLEIPLARPAAVLALHGQLAAVAWAFAQAAPGRRLGYVQTGGGALPGGHSGTVAALRERGLLAGHLTAGPAFGGDGEAITTAGALHHGMQALGWDAAVCGPGPGIVGSGSSLGHGGMAALDSAHVALALGCPTLLVARMSCSDRRSRHRSISHHTLTVLDLLLEPVTVALPAGIRSPVGADLRAGLRGVFASAKPAAAAADEVARPARIARHDWKRAEIDLPGFAGSGLATESMGRGPAEDPLFFGAALAGGAALTELLLSDQIDPSTGLDAALGEARAARTTPGADRAAGPDRAARPEPAS